MQTGVLSDENLGQVLRNISQRRQQGLLEVTLQDRKVQVSFVQGKVIDVTESDRDPAGSLLQILKSGGLVEQEFSSKANSYAALLDELVAQDLIDEERFKQILKQRVLDRLYALDLGTGAYFQFKVQMIDIERDILPSISVGQLLLDFVSLGAEAPRFRELFAQERIELVRLESGAASLNDEEQALIESISVHGSTLEEVSDRAMLSRYHLQEGLLSLYDQGLLEVRKDGEKSQQQVDDMRLDDIVSVLEESIDSVFGSEARREAPEDDDEEEHEESAFDDEDSDIEIQVPSYIGILNAKLLQTNWVPAIIVFMFLAAALLAPILFWGEIFTKFADL